MIGELAAIDWLMWLVRWVHAVGAVAWVGGSIFFAIVLRPVLAANPAVSRQLMGPIGSIYKELVDAAVLALIVSGLVLMFDRLTGNQVTPTWFIVLGISWSSPCGCSTWCGVSVVRATNRRPGPASCVALPGFSATTPSWP